MGSESATGRKSPPKRRVLDKPKHKAQIIEWMLEGQPNREIAKRMNVHHQAIAGFRKRHAAELETVETRVLAEVIDPAITNKAERINRLATLYDRMAEIVNTRGLMATETRFVGGADYGREIEVQRFDAALTKEMRAALRDVAEELGQIPKAGITVYNDNRTVIGLELIDGIRARLR